MYGNSRARDVVEPNDEGCLVAVRSCRLIAPAVLSVGAFFSGHAQFVIW